MLDLPNTDYSFYQIENLPTFIPGMLYKQGVCSSELPLASRLLHIKRPEAALGYSPIAGLRITIVKIWQFDG